MRTIVRAARKGHSETFELHDAQILGIDLNMHQVQHDTISRQVAKTSCHSTLSIASYLDHPLVVRHSESIKPLWNATTEACGHLNGHAKCLVYVLPVI